MLESNGKKQIKTSFKVIQSIGQLYTGGKACITSDENALITTVGEDIDVINIYDGQKLFRLSGDSDLITTFGITPDDKLLVSASRSLLVKIWDLKTGKLLRTFRAHDSPIIVMAIDPTSSLVATGSADGVVKIWDIEGGFCTHNFHGHGGVISSLKFYKQGQNNWKLASGSDDCNIRIWDLHKRSCVAILKNHVSLISGLDVSNDGRYLISSSRDKVICTWDLHNIDNNKKILINTFPIYETIEVIGVLEENSTDDSGSSSKELIYTGGDKGIIRVWELHTGKLFMSQEPEKNTKYTIKDIIYLRKSKSLIAVTDDQNFLFYNLSKNLKRYRQIIGNNDEILDLSFIGPDETHLAIATNTEQIGLFNMTAFDFNIVYGHNDIVICLDKNNTGDILISGSKDHTIRIWKFDLNSQDASDRVKCLGVCVGHTEAVGSVVMSKKTENFCISGSADRTIKYWDLSSIDKSDPDENHKPKSLYTHHAHDKDINTIAISPNEKIFATGSQDKTIKIWSTKDGNLVGKCLGHKRGVWSIDFSRMDQTLLSSSGDKTIKIWNLNDFTCLKTFEGHQNTVLRSVFITSGSQVVSCGSDGLIKIWLNKTTECINTLDNHTEKIWALTVNKNENLIISGGADKQDLANYLQKKDYKNAILLAISLDQPHRLLNLFKQIMNNRPEGDSSITGLKTIDGILINLEKENLEKILTYIRDWNTNSKNFQVSQTILNVLLRNFNSNQLLEIDGIKESQKLLMHFPLLHALSTKQEPPAGRSSVSWHLNVSEPVIRQIKVIQSGSKLAPTQGSPWLIRHNLLSPHTSPSEQSASSLQASSDKCVHIVNKYQDMNLHKNLKEGFARKSFVHVFRID
ncbi:11188_t:CDS:10 [Entrophospora sp. SA101]|nr:11188_t:CDS:10 [Entrophospora sp. SA101]